MGAEDTRRQELNVFRMEMLGAKVVAVEEGNKTLKEAVDKALEAVSYTHLDVYKRQRLNQPYYYIEFLLFGHIH